jgi:predicted nucleotide-binding protein (sugar kinase/HSP70/actin superfamily)
MLLATPTLSLNFRLDVSVEVSAHFTDFFHRVKPKDKVYLSFNQCMTTLHPKIKKHTTTNIKALFFR